MSAAKLPRRSSTRLKGFEGALGVRVEDKRQGPPKLHDLPSLQKLCSSRFGWPASKTLDVAQELYDGQGKKIITYPRAEVRYLPESLIPDVPKIVAGLRAGKSFSSIPVPDPPTIRKGASGSFYDKGLEGASHHAVIPNVNMVDHLREVWPRLSMDEKKLFDVIARAYLAAVMPDFRYRQTTATLDVRGFVFRAAGRQPIELGWRAAFPDWRPADEKGDEAQLLPALRNGETAKLEHPTIEEKETRPPPRYNEGTLIEAMQNAWRFVDDEVLRERLKEAKGIGTPATRAEIIGGLKKQAFLTAAGKNIVPTDVGLQLYGILQQADPALVDPGLTAQLECLLDEVVIGKQEMIGAIDAVCDVAQRIIGKLQDGAATGDQPLPGAALAGDAGSRPPTPAMKRFADSISRQKGVKPPPGYATSGSICRAFLDQHAPQQSRHQNSWRVWRQTRKSRAAVVCREDGPGQRHRCSRRSQSQFGGHVGMDRLGSGHTAWQAPSHARSRCRRDRKHLRKQQRPKGDLGNPRQMARPRPLRQCLLGRLREPTLACGFPMATRTTP